MCTAEIECEVTEEGAIRQRREIDRDPPYYYGTLEWDAKVREALEAVDAGQTEYCDSDEEFLASFK
jgi:hypothetical protein